MATKTKTKPKQENGYQPRLKQRYVADVRPKLKDELGLDSIMQVPRIEKITLNMGVGDAKTNSKLLDAAMEQMATIAGQKPLMTRATKSVASFKLREGMPIEIGRAHV